MTESKKKARRNPKAIVTSQVEYIESLQKAVESSVTEVTFTEEKRVLYVPSDELREIVETANNQLSKKLKNAGQPQVKLGITTEKSTSGGNPVVRVTHPTKTTISAEVPSLSVPNHVEFYKTQLGVDGSAETRLLGIAKYADKNGRRSVTFQTERFADKQNNPLIIHGELVDGNGYLLAAYAVPLAE